MVSQKVVDLCRSNKTVSSELGRDPTLAPGKVVKELYGDDVAGHDELEKFKEPHATAEDLERAHSCGNWGKTQPSELFLRVSHILLEKNTYDTEASSGLSRCAVHTRRRSNGRHDLAAADGKLGSGSSDHYRAIARHLSSHV